MPVDKIAKIKEFKELLDAGALTQEEFEAEKKKILNAPADVPQEVTPEAVQPVMMGTPAPQPMVMPQPMMMPQQAAPNIVVQNVVQGGGYGRTHKYDASVLSGQWTVDIEACPGCCLSTVTITAMGDDAFELRGPSNRDMYTRQGATDNFQANLRGNQTGLCLILNHNEMKINAGTHGNFLCKRVNPLPTSGGQLQQPGMQQPGLTQMPSMPMAPQPQQMRQGLLQQGYS